MTRSPISPTIEPPDPQTWVNGASEVPSEPTIYVCQHQHCRIRGAMETMQAFVDRVPDGTRVCASQCMGQCTSGPTVRVSADETWYCNIAPKDVDTIVEQHLKGGEPVSEKLNARLHLRYYG